MMNKNDEAALRNLRGDEALREWLEVGEPRMARQLARRIATRFPDSTYAELKATLTSELRMSGINARLASEVAKEIALKRTR
jgi:hypothetical protein